MSDKWQSFVESMADAGWKLLLDGTTFQHENRRLYDSTGKRRNKSGKQIDVHWIAYATTGTTPAPF